MSAADRTGNDASDRKLGYVFLAAIVAFVVWLALDRPPPNPDFHVYARQADDMAAMKKTEEKFPPLYPLMLAPSSRAGLAAQETVAIWIDVASFAVFGLALLAILGRLGIAASALVIAGVLANRYALGPAVAGTAHAPFWALTAVTVWACLAKRWLWAYVFASAALLTRYNGVVLPPIVALWQVGATWNEARLGRRLLIGGAATALAIAPLAAWLALGTATGIESYAQESAARGVAGPSALKYPLAAVSVSFVDPTTTRRISEGMASSIPVVLAAAPVFGLATVGLIAGWKRHRMLVALCAVWGAWWAAIHTRFAEVGGLYLYSVQVTWLIWLLAAAGLGAVGTWNPWLWLLTLLPAAGMFANSTGTHLWAALGASVGTLLGIGLLAGPKQRIAVAAAAGAIASIGLMSAYEKIYEKNYRAANSQLVAWAASERGILISTGMHDEFAAEGLPTSGFIPESKIDGRDIPRSLASLGIRFAAIGDWEMAERGKPDFFPGHEFFLGSRYPTTLRPYRLIADIHNGDGWRPVREFRARSTTITIYEKE